MDSILLVCGIYKITSPSNKVYIGQSADIWKRFVKYKYGFCKGQPYLYNSILKHGFENHKFEIIHKCEESELDHLETYYINLYDSYNSKIGMNLRSGGGRGSKLSDFSKKKMGGTLKLNWAKRKENGTHRQSRETVNKRIASYKKTLQSQKEQGIIRVHTKEAKEKVGLKLREYQKNIRKSPEYYSKEQIEKRKQIAKKAYSTFVANGKKRTKNKNFDISGKNNPFYGKKHSKETLAKIAASRKITWDKKMENGYKQSEEHVKKRVAKQLGKKRTDKQREAMRNVMKLRKENGFYEKNKEVLSAGQKEAWKKKKKAPNYYSEEAVSKRTAIANKIWAKRRENLLK